MAMKLATWNINSIRSRLSRVLGWLESCQPDVLCLQELKVPDEEFPHDAIQAVGYQAAVHGQKTYNGVAILAKGQPEVLSRGFGHGRLDDQARLIDARVGRVRVICAYFPNGGTVGSDKYAYKLQWMARLRSYLDATASPAEPLALCGDFNVAPDDLDVADPQQWADTVLCHTDARAALERIRSWGLIDVFRKLHPQGHVYSWWDYRMLAFPKNNGLRIDHIFATEPLARRCVSAGVDRDQRKGTKDDKPSDHAPVWAEFEL